MTLVAKSAAPAALSPGDAPARWEQRSVSRALDGSRELLERSRQIVEAAYELLENEGLDRLTIRAVLKKTGLSRRAFYERFSGKDDMLLAVFEQTIRFAATHYQRQVSQLSDPMERLQLIVTCIVLGKSSPQEVDRAQSNLRGAAMSREHLRLAESRPDDLEASLSPLISLIAQQLADGMAVGIIRQYSPQRLAILVYNLVATTVHTELLAHENAHSDPARRAQLAADIWDFCRRAIIA